MQGYKQSSIKLEIKIIKEFANYLQKNGFIKDATCNLPIPRMTHEAKEEEENEKAFNEEQIVLMRTELHKQIADAEGVEVYKWKQVLQYFELMLEGGFRTDELVHVEWRDIQMKANGECLMDVRIFKTGRRNSVFISKTIPLIRASQENKKVPVKKDTSLWTNPGTQKRWSKQFFTRRFRIVLGAVGLGKEFRHYGCRVTHITRGIYKDFSTYLIAKNLGTSEGMIHRQYENVIIEEQTMMRLQGQQKVLGFSWNDRKASEQDFSLFV